MGECSALLEIYLSFTGYLRWAENDGEHIAFGCSLLTSSDDCQRNPAKSMKVKGYEKQWKAPTWLTVAKRREWMGCWGLLGWLLIVSQWIIPENSLRLAIKNPWNSKEWSVSCAQGPVQDNHRGLVFCEVPGGFSWHLNMGGGSMMFHVFFFGFSWFISL